MKKVLLILLFFFAALSVRSKFSDISHFFPVWSHFSAPVPTIIITQPANSTTCIGTNATFTVVALNATGYQWQVNQGSGYLNIANGGRYSGANTATLNITGATANMSTYTYRCLVMGDIPAASTPATLTVRQAPVITQNPMPNTICEGENVLFYIAATNATAYRWQVNTGSGFTDLSDGPGATGGTYVNTHTAVLYITGATVAMSDYYYRCVVTGACTPGATSAAAAFTVLANETYYEDYDGDGYGNAAVTNISCTAPIGFVSNNQDCDDNNPSLHPGATEICGDGIDNNCNGQIDEGCSAGITNVTSSNANSTYKIDDIIDIQLIFSAAVNVTGSPSLMLNNGGTATYASGDGTSTLTFSYTVVSGQNSSNLDYSSSNALSFNGGSISNVSGGSPAILTLPAPGSAGSLGANKTFIIDATRPTAGIVVANTSLSFGQTSLITITFSEAVIGFTDSDLMVQNGAISMLNSSDGGRTWTARLTPSPSVTDPSNLITLNNSDVTDENGNAGIGTATSNNYAIDNIRPTAGIAVTNTNLTFGTTSTVTITFNEAVTGFTTDDLTVENGVVSDLSSSDGGTTWTALLTPNNSITDATNVITLDNTGVTDLADNTGTGVTNSNNYEVNTNRPTATIVVADNALSIGETPTVTITFSEAVTGFTNDDLTIANGTLSAVNSTDGGITWKATLTPAAEITYLANVITLDNTGVTAVLSGNAGTGVTNSNNYTIDTNRPTATIVVADA
uniref:Ig-like domain-containing protein n=1 Tax=Pedobacter nyackensis TaxID=475255 RepID=UPI002930B795